MGERNALMCVWVPPSLILSRLDGNFNHPTAIETRRKVSSTFNSRKFGQACTNIVCGPFGSTLLSDEHSATGEVVLVQPTDISDDLFALEPGWRLEEAKRREKNLDLYTPGTLLFARVGQYPHCGVLPDRIGAATISSSMIAAEIASPADPYFFNAFFRCKHGSALLFAAQKITAQPTIGTEELADTIVPYPDPTVQRAIGNKLRKAERLREMSEEAWGAAQLLFERASNISLSSSGFEKLSAVESSPDYTCVSTKPAASWVYRCDVLAAQYFHPRRVHARNVATSSKRSDALANMTSIVRSRQRGESWVLCIGLDQIDSRLGVISQEGSDSDQDQPSEIEFRPGYILFSRLRPYLNKVAIWPSDWPTGTGSGELVVLKPKGDVDSHFLFFMLKSPLGLYQIFDVTAGSTLPRVESDVITDIRIPRMSEDKERSIGNSVRASHKYWYESLSLISAAKSDVLALIDGFLDRSTLMTESTMIEQWLNENPRSGKEMSSR